MRPMCPLETEGGVHPMGVSLAVAAMRAAEIKAVASIRPGGRTVSL